MRNESFIIVLSIFLLAEITWVAPATCSQILSINFWGFGCNKKVKMLRDCDFVQFFYFIWLECNSRIFKDKLEDVPLIFLFIFSFLIKILISFQCCSKKSTSPKDGYIFTFPSILAVNLLPYISFFDFKYGKGVLQAKSAQTPSLSSNGMLIIPILINFPSRWVVEIISVERSANSKSYTCQAICLLFKNFPTRLDISKNPFFFL